VFDQAPQPPHLACTLGVDTQLTTFPASPRVDRHLQQQCRFALSEPQRLPQFHKLRNDHPQWPRLYVTYIACPHAAPRRPPSQRGRRRRPSHSSAQTTTTIGRAAVDAARPGHRPWPRTLRPTDSARTPAAPPAPLASSGLDRSRPSSSADEHSPQPACSRPPIAPPTCPIDQRMTDSNRQPVRFPDEHLYAAYSTWPVAHTGSPRRVSMPSHAPAQTSPIRLANPTNASFRVRTAVQQGALKTLTIRRA
jgi:hypothetical protein